MSNNYQKQNCVNRYTYCPIEQPFFFTYVVLLILVFSSCGAALYGPVMLNNDITYQAKPMLKDSLKTNLYISGVYCLSGAQNLGDEQLFGEFNINRAHAFKNFNLSYGSLVYFGNYRNGYFNSGDPAYFDHKSFWGYGFKTAVNYVMPLERTEFRFPGLEMIYTNELGAFADYRKKLMGQSGFYINPNTNVFSYGGSAEVIWHQKKHFYNRFSFRLFIGRTVGNNEFKTGAGDTYVDNSLNNLTSLSFMFQHKRMAFLYESGHSVKFGFIYSFK